MLSSRSAANGPRQSASESVNVCVRMRITVYVCESLQACVRAFASPSLYKGMKMCECMFIVGVCVCVREGNLERQLSHFYPYTNAAVYNERKFISFLSVKE